MSNYMRQPQGRRARRPGGRMFAMFNTLGDAPNLELDGSETAPWNPEWTPGETAPEPTETAATADPQTAYAACLKGGGSAASCNQIPGVTPEMIAAAKSGRPIPSSGKGMFASIPKTALYVVGGGLLLYLFTRRR